MEAEMTKKTEDRGPETEQLSVSDEQVLIDRVVHQEQPKRSYVLQAFVESPWAILPYKLAVLEEIVVRHVSGEKLDAEEIQARINGARRPADRQVQAVAVLPLFGVIFPRANLMTEMSGATSAEVFGAQFSELVADPKISAIVIDVDSPGGQVDGIEELSQKIFEARGQKPIVAVADHTMASAAYWIGTAADELVASPSSEVGSIGVFAVHQDVSQALEKQGVKVSLISRGKYKVEGNPYEPLSEEARSAIDTRVGDYYDAFVNSVARNRGVEADAVRNGFGEGRVVGARQAVELGMADRLGTLEETIDRLLSNQALPGPRQANQSVNGPGEMESSASSDPDFERQAKRLRDYVELYK
jgi:signal peptide peptidase SppA